MTVNLLDQIPQIPKAWQVPEEPLATLCDQIYSLHEQATRKRREEDLCSASRLTLKQRVLECEEEIKRQAPLLQKIETARNRLQGLQAQQLSLQEALQRAEEEKERASAVHFKAVAYRREKGTTPKWNAKWLGIQKDKSSAFDAWRRAKVACEEGQRAIEAQSSLEKRLSTLIEEKRVEIERLQARIGRIEGEIENLQYSASTYLQKADALIDAFLKQHAPPHLEERIRECFRQCFNY